MKLIINTLLFGCLLLVMPTIVQAQTCSGNITCCSAASTVLVWRRSDGTDCGGPGAGCTPTSECTDSGITHSCSFGGPVGSCDLWVPDSLCNFQMGGSCTYTPPAATPTPPGSTPAPGFCSTGNCFTGISNCGERGPLVQTGTCSIGGASGLCCATAGGSGSCSVNSFSPNPITIQVGETINLSTTAYNGIWETDVRNVRWSMGSIAEPWGQIQNSYARLNSISSGSTSDNSRDPQNVTNVSNQITGISQGTTFVKVDYQVYSINDGSLVNNANCNRAIPVIVTGPDSWAKIFDGDLLTSGNVSVSVPSGKYLLGNSSSSEGIVVYGNSITLGAGEPSSSGWVSRNGGIGKALLFNQLREQVPSSATVYNLTSPSLFGSLPSTTTDSQGYRWYERANNNLTITGDLTVPASSKSIVFVNGNLTINGEIAMADPESSFLMFIVSGDISVGPGVGESSPTSTTVNLQGIFVTDERFTTQTGNRKLNVFGSVIAIRGLQLNRDTQSEQPSETFTFSPELIVNFPPSLGVKRAFWKEVAP